MFAVQCIVECAVFIVLSALRPELVVAQPGCGASHVIIRWSQLSLHHPVC